MNVHGLTRREMQVLCLLCEGKNCSQIAQECGLSETTISKYVSTIKILFMPEYGSTWTDDQLRDYARADILPCYQDERKEV